MSTIPGISNANTGTISSAGIGSGLDVKSIVAQLMTSEQGPLKRLQSQEGATTAKISAYGQIQSSLGSFQTALTTLGSGGLTSQLASSSDVGTLGVTASSDATSGTYSVNVSQLASFDKLVSAGVPTSPVSMADGSMTIQVGAGKSFNFSGSYSVKDLAQAINTAGAGVTASVINDGTANHLSLTSTVSGAANQISVTASGGLAQFDTNAMVTVTNPDGSLQTKKAMTDIPGQDAKLMIDGVSITKSTNSITDAISGVTLNLSKVSASSTSNTTISVTRDDTKIKANISSFVSAYNSLLSTVKNLTSYNLGTKTAAVLNSDAAANSVLSQIGRVVSQDVSGGAFNTLPSIGITRKTDGSLSIDDTKLSVALSTNAAGVNNLFNGANGIAISMTKVAATLISPTGILASNQTNFASTVKSLQNREAAEATRLTSVQAAYQKQFSALDTLLSSMTSQNAFLTQALAKL